MTVTRALTVLNISAGAATPWELGRQVGPHSTLLWCTVHCR